MTKSREKQTIDHLIEKASTYIESKNELELIKKSYEYAKEKHNGVLRQSGEAYINHPLATAIILTSVYADADTICAGLLHDIIEDTDVTKQDIQDKFGVDIANLVYGVTKISKLHFSTENEALIEYYKKIIVGMSEDVRVIIIKLADRLHNMRTLWALSEEKQKKKAKETLEILSPIAHHLGIHKIKSELEDLSLRYLKPDIFYDIAQNLNNTKLERDKVVNEMLTSVSDLLNKHEIKHEIKGRSKSIYSIYKKLEKGKKFNEIYDLLALRVIVDTEQECYTALGIVHSKYRPIPKRFKDYVAMPKPNGYQSLHTTVFGIDGYLFEIQIRTHDMDEVAENGVASHWAYKENKTLVEGIRSSTEAKLEFFKSIIELNEDKMSSEDFVNSVKNEILNNNIYVFTPKGDVFELPNGSTPIDFAYRVHTRVGETTSGAIVNNNMVPLSYKLKNNDIVKIITNKNQNGPSLEWLNVVASTQAKNKIRAFFSKSEKENYIERGKDLLEKEMRKQKLIFNEFLSDENINKIIKELKLNDLDELYLSIGNNKYSANYIISIIIKKEQKTKEIIKIHNISSDNNIIVEGIDKVKVNIANCCNPIPGDEIIGYITKGNGISVHRNNCPNLANLDDRMINVKWNETIKGKYNTPIVIYSKPSDKALVDIVQKASLLSVGINSIKTVNGSEETIYEVDLNISDSRQLNKLMKELINIKYINNVMRFIK
ncbi:MAG: bifunctional (p)ppGpp synthetase/guanosine-3',5'-bis(diphosphate) 3'-pyrophosphohydrolase [bacterium]|nr:bifunctional (p)ppGpp synthetase/guanosine-3',5'-bis(diphosphate) 3'-pyrophosphohydrolase [bacterium]